MSHQVTSEHLFVIRAFLRRNRFFRDEAEVLRKRHIDGLTMEAVGRYMGVISSRIDQIERQAIKKIRGAA